MNTSTNILSCPVSMCETFVIYFRLHFFLKGTDTWLSLRSLGLFFFLVTGTRSTTEGRRRRCGDQSKTLAGQTRSRRRQTTYRSGGRSRNPTEASLGTSGPNTVERGELREYARERENPRTHMLFVVTF
jgi:hypothetical protein